jgi:hypothetical protein
MILTVRYYPCGDRCRAGLFFLEMNSARTTGRAFLSRIGAHVEKFSRTFDELALSLRAFLVGRVPVAEAINFVACHLGCLAPTAAAALRRGGCPDERSFGEMEDRCRASRHAWLSAPPFVEFHQQLLMAPNPYGRGAAEFHSRCSWA